MKNSGIRAAIKSGRLLQAGKFLAGERLRPAGCGRHPAGRGFSRVVRDGSAIVAFQGREIPPKVPVGAGFITLEGTS